MPGNWLSTGVRFRRSMKRFDPFTDRLSRDIRNDLSKALMISLRDLNPAPVQEVADHYLAGALEYIYRQYINDRLEKYYRVLDIIRERHFEDTFSMALVLWDEELFFEVHEILEHEWLKSTGAAKLVLQAMIRAAGMYVQMDHDNYKGAASMAAKAVTALENNRSAVPETFDLDLLLAKLRKVDPIPPRLNPPPLDGNA